MRCVLSFRFSGVWVSGVRRLTGVQAVDTVLAKLYTKSGETTDLLALIDGPNDVVLAEVEAVLVEAHSFDVLCRIYTTRGETQKLLEAWSKCVWSHSRYLSYSLKPRPD